MDTKLKEFTVEEVARHNLENDCWIIVDNKVFDVTKFASLHPGGMGVIYDVAGKDATEAFYSFHRMDVLRKYAPRLQIGVIASRPIPREPQLGDMSTVPYSESELGQGMRSPFYKKSHAVFRKAVRAWVDAELAPMAATWEETGKGPMKELIKKMGDSSLLACRLAPGPHLKHFSLFGGIKPEEFDQFHELIAHEEVARLGCPGLFDGLGSGFMIGLPPLLHFASPAIQKTVAMDCIRGDKVICLAITEPVAGSDVANIAARATKSPCGKFFIVNGVKKWITNGTFADYFVTAVRTGGSGIGGISLLLIERGPGLETELIRTSYSPVAGTAYVTMRNVKVPVENILGVENQGFKCIMHNFNHERWILCVVRLREMRLILEECLKWTSQRKVFGNALNAQPVVRNKLARMITTVESTQSWLDAITNQMNVMSFEDQQKHLAGPIALLKYTTTRGMLTVCDDASQLFGGRAISRTGMGQVVERLARAQKFGAILGGSEEVMADLGVRQALKYMPEHSRL
eukprot:c17733_g1_i1.p1 GENE.c17733_g1_i1~~c17733_g1_i1.p1  ORF type:complete len:531 (+),score=158.27 c17733_g1_i1:43-1593(+)